MSTVAKTSTKNRPKRFKGICADAKLLNVTRVHLWQVLTGRRESKPLLAEYQELKRTGTAPANSRKGRYLNSQKTAASPKMAPPSVNIAADENLSPEFFSILQKLGFELVLVRFAAGPESPVWNFPGIEAELGAALAAAKAGHHDSTAYESGFVVHYFYISGSARLATALQTLKAAIEARGLLPITTILHGENHDALRIYYPPHDPKNQVVSVPVGANEPAP